MLHLQQEIHQKLNIKLWIISVIAGIFCSTLVFAFMPFLKKDIKPPTFSEYISYVDVIRIKRKTKEANEFKKRKEKKRNPKRLKKLLAKAVYIGPKVKFKNLNLPFEVNLKLPPISSDIAVQPAISVSNLGIDGAFTINEVDSPPIPIVQMPPIYPVSARMKGIEGWVIVRFIVDEKGRVRNIHIIKSKPKGIFEDSVIRCVSKWRFKPAVFEGINVKTLVQTKICFRLD